MKPRFLFLFVLILTLFLTACGKEKIENEVNWPIKDFSATTQQNKSMGLKDLKGKVWVSAFIFTSCADVCPPMTSNMVTLQKN